LENVTNAQLSKKLYIATRQGKQEQHYKGQGNHASKSFNERTQKIVAPACLLELDRNTPSGVPNGVKIA
jgi:hypothetical protein